MCFTPAELRDQCSAVHLLSVHEGLGEGGMGGGRPQGDGGTALCPSAEELYFGGSLAGCGCLYAPTCESPTVERGGSCCYLIATICLLC
jgi:hypothetical protein